MDDLVFVLKELVSRAKGISDHFVDYELPAKYYGSRKDIFEKLQNDGYVTRVDYYGKNFVRCLVTDKAFEFVLGDE